MRDLLSGIWAASAASADAANFSPREWEALLGQARRSRLLARLAVHFAEQPGGLAAVPSPQQQYLQGALALVERQRHEVLAELAHLRRALKGVSAPVVLLKGAAYLLAGLPPARGRVFSDIDLLVGQPQLNEVEGVLFAAGWISQERDAYNQRYYRQWMHEIPPLTHVTRHSVIDLHHTIAPPTSRFKVNAVRLFERIQPIGSSGFFMLGPEDMVLHSASHLYQEGEFDHGLRDLLDVVDLLTHFGRVATFWQTLLARAAELGLGEPLHHLIEQARRLGALRVPVDCEPGLRALRPAWPARGLVAALLTQVLRPQHPSCDTRRAQLARWLLYLRSHQLRMPVRLLIPHLVRKAYTTRFVARNPEKAQT